EVDEEPDPAEIRGRTSKLHRQRMCARRESPISDSPESAQLRIDFTEPLVRCARASLPRAVSGEFVEQLLQRRALDALGGAGSFRALHRCDDGTFWQSECRFRGSRPPREVRETRQLAERES